jgi:hypothetical protein
MDVTNLTALATQLATTTTQQAAQIAVLRKAMDLQGQGALQLVNSATQSFNNPAHLGSRINLLA